MHQNERMDTVLRTIDAGDLQTAGLMLARSANAKKRKMAREALMLMARMTPERTRIIAEWINGGGSLRHPQNSMKPEDDFLGPDHDGDKVRKEPDDRHNHQQSSLHGNDLAVPDAPSS